MSDSENTTTTETVAEPPVHMDAPIVAEPEPVVEPVALVTETTVVDTPEPVPSVAPQTPPPQVFDMTVDEYCTRRSSTDRRIEMLSGFRSDEVRNGHFKGSGDDFDKRYEDFCVREVS